VLGVLAVSPQAALALPFDPVPSAFQRWLNAKQDWPNNEHGDDPPGRPGQPAL